MELHLKICKKIAKEENLFMNVELNSVDAQYYLIYFFSKMLPEQEMYVLNMLSRQKIDEKVYQYIMMCMSHAREVGKNKKYCSDLVSTCKSMANVIRMEKNLDVLKKVKQGDYLEAFGSFEEKKTSKEGETIIETKTLNKQQFGRFKKGSIPDPRFIKSLSNQFRDDVRRRFWRNWILYYWTEAYWRDETQSGSLDLKDISDANRKKNNDKEKVSIKDKLRKGKCVKKVKIENANIESKSFNIVMNLLRKNNQNFIEKAIKGLPQNQKDKIKALLELHSYNCEESKLGTPPYKLYDVIDHLRNGVGMSLEELRSEINISEPTWSKYKHNWLQAEKTYFEYVTKEILKRYHILLIAIIFELDYMETLILLQIAGYRMGNNNQDKELIDYFLYRIGSVEKIKVTLFQKTGK